MTRRAHVLILLENLPLARDMRVRHEVQSLAEAGYAVTVVCPRGPSRWVFPGVRVLDYPAPPEGTSIWHFLAEYTWSLVAMAFMTARAAMVRHIDVVQSCNPPDIFWLIALPLKLAGAKFVFDHHDLSPDLYEARTGRSQGLVAWGLRANEAISLRTADHVIATNDSVRSVALRRGGRSPTSVTVVRNGPELHRVSHAAVHDRRASSQGQPYVGVWIGVVGVDDGVEDALRAIAELVHAFGRTDCRFVFIGDGERLTACKQLTIELGIGPYVTFTGWQDQDALYGYLAAADIALAPDPPGGRAERATMVKVMEYMAAGIPVVAFDVHETRESAAGAAVYAPRGDLAKAIDHLLDDPDARARMGEEGRRRIRSGLSWDHQRLAYVRVFDQLTRAVEVG